MAQIHGQVESLKRLRNELKSKGINRFNSVRDIHDFVDNFQIEKDQVVIDHEQRLRIEIEGIRNNIGENQKKYESIKSKASFDLDHKINKLKLRIAVTNNKVNTRFINNLLCRFKLRILQIMLNSLIGNYSNIVQWSVHRVKKELERDSKKLIEFTENTQEVLNDRCLPELNQLNFIKSTIQDLNPLIAGAIGESLVVKEIEKLSDDYILINDFSKSFNPPLYKKSNGDRILSIQVDHLLISKAGIFILETKNWGKNSMESLDLRSPVDQIERTNYAIYRLLSNAIDCGEIRLNKHHWGDRKIPLRNVIVMIHEKPKEEFKYVKIKALYQLNRYFSFFEDFLSENEMNSLVKYFIDNQDV